MHWCNTKVTEWQRVLYLFGDPKPQPQLQFRSLLYIFAWFLQHPSIVGWLFVSSVFTLFCFGARAILSECHVHRSVIHTNCLFGSWYMLACVFVCLYVRLQSSQSHFISEKRSSTAKHKLNKQWYWIVFLPVLLQFDFVVRLFFLFSFFNMYFSFTSQL